MGDHGSAPLPRSRRLSGPVDAVLAGDRPFDEATMLDDDGHGGGSSDDAEQELPAVAGRPAR